MDRRYRSLSMGGESESGEEISDKWRSVLVPLMWRYKKLNKHAILQMELQAISAGSKGDEHKYLIHPTSRLSQTWKTVMALTVVCSVMEVPFICCFTPMQDDGVITRPAEYFHLFYRFVVDMIFVADIFVNFRTGYHKLGAVVMNKELIERHYLRHGFALDVIAALPITCFPVTILFSILCRYDACPPEIVRYLFRYIRLLQLAKVGPAMSQLALFMEKLSDQTSTLITSLTELILFFVVLTHWFTCAWFLVQVYPINFQVQSEAHPAKHLTLHDSWLANNGETDPAVYASVDSFLGGSISFKETFILYINCFFWASSANDAYTTMNTSEKLVAILAQILIENGFMAFILASLISSLEEHSRGRKKHTMYRSKIDAVNDFMRHEGFPSDIIDNVREYYKYVWLPQQIDFTEANLHEELPHYLRTEVMSIITRKVLLTSDFMTKYFGKSTAPAGSDAAGKKVSGSSKTAWIRQISEMLVPKFYIAQQYVMKQGDVGTELYIIKQGKVAVEIDIDDGSSKVVAEPGPGSIFGDIALLGLNTTRTASIRTITNCIIFELKQEDMQKVWDSDPTLKMYMLDVAKEHLGRRKSTKKKDPPPPKDSEKKDEGSNGSGGGSASDKAISKFKSHMHRHPKSPPKPFHRTESEEVQAQEIQSLEDEVPSLRDAMEGHRGSPK